MLFDLIYLLATLSSRVLALSSDKDCHDHVPGLVDLGYAKHIPTSINTTASGHNVSIYQNVRFANAPTGDLRFRKPDTDLPIIEGIQDGKAPFQSLSCISSAPAMAPIPDINGTTWGQEDCLFLDVYVPEGVKPGDDVPVLHYFYGSAYAFGSKEFLFNPMGLFDRMFEEHSGKFIFVANNYRMGISGFAYSEEEDMDANVGLFDCLAATEWTSKYIHHFGGSGRRITAAGQSAGAGMLYYMSVLNGGEGVLPFQRMFVSSPAAPARRDVSSRLKEQFGMVLEAANCSSIECLRELSEDALVEVNDKIISRTPTNSGGGMFGPVIGFGPVPDGGSIPDMPLALYQQGKYHDELEGVMVGSTAMEGMGISHDTDLPEYFPIMVRQIMSTASNETVEEVQGMYPFDPEFPATLAWEWTTDAIFACNSYNLVQALPSKSRRYIMSTPPATHGQDLWFYFYVDQERTPLEDYLIELAWQFQNELLRFIHGQDMQWPLWGSDKQLVNMTDIIEATNMLPVLEERCETLNRLELDPTNGA